MAKKKEVEVDAAPEVDIAPEVSEAPINTEPPDDLKQAEIPSAEVIVTPGINVRCGHCGKFMFVAEYADDKGALLLKHVTDNCPHAGKSFIMEDMIRRITVREV